MRKLCKILSFILLIFSLHSAAFCVEPSEILVDPAKEIRARALSSQLRCLVCQNQSIDDSNAELAKDLRQIVRKQIEEGSSDDAVLAYLVSRYGEFILLNPRFSSRTFLLWILPFFVFCVGCIIIWKNIRKSSQPNKDGDLSHTEREKLNTILNKL